MNNNEKALLEDACYCAGIEVEFSEAGGDFWAHRSPFVFDPFARVAHAAELQCAARIDVKYREGRVIGERFVGGYLAKSEVETHAGRGRDEATRLAVIRCAAEAGRYMRDHNIKEQP